MKIIAWYLPQFHEIPENNEWWGAGFTEWTNLKKGCALTPNHNQPRIPKDNNYYNLLDDNVKAWQVNLAKKYGIYGFCMHHYWFNGKLLLEKPVEQYLENKELDLPFCLNWANEHWTNQWVSNSQKILIEQTYGCKKQWKEHFDYLLPFFKDSRYIKIEGKPFFSIFRPELIENIGDMVEYFQELAKENGLPGISFAYQGSKWDFVDNKDDAGFDFDLEYQPILCWSKKRQNYLSVRIQDALPKSIMKIFSKPLNILKGWIFMNESRNHNELIYDDVWQEILDYEPANTKCIPGAFVDWDNTPRKGDRGIYLKDTTPQKFQKYFEEQIMRAKDVYKKDMLFVFSWNEWCEGGYLEPDEKNGTKFLEAIKQALINTGEWEKNE